MNPDNHPQQENPDVKYVPVNGRIEYLKAFAATQTAVKPMLRNKTNDHFGNSYADLDAMYESIEEAVIKNGLVIEQWTEERDAGLYLLTQLVHVETGYAGKLSTCKLRMGKNDMPAVGSGLTYGRRQQVMCVLQLAPKDDDGKATMTKDMTGAQHQQITAFLKKLDWTMDESVEASEAATGKASSKDYDYADAELFIKHLETKVKEGAAQ